MWKQRYPHKAVGKLAAIGFAIVGLLAGILVAQLLEGAPSYPFNAAVWALICAGCAFMVYSSEAPRRPLSLGQAVIADGVVTGITAGFAAMILDLIFATNVAVNGTRIDFLGGMGRVLLTGLCGALVGAATGAVLFAVIPKERLFRTPAPTPGMKTRRRKNSRRRR